MGCRAFWGETHPDIAGSREEIAEAVETSRHHPVGCVERLFNAVSVMNIDVDI